MDIKILLFLSLLPVSQIMIKGEELYNDWTKELTVQLIPANNWRMAIGSNNLNEIYLIGGYGTNNASKSLITYHIDNNTFIENGIISSLPINGIGQYYTMHQNTIYMINPSGTSFIRYNITSKQLYETWNTINIGSNVLDTGCLASYNDFLFIVGGANNGSLTHSFNLQILDIVNELWIDDGLIPKLQERRGGSACVVHTNNGHLYALSGYTNKSTPEYSITAEYLQVNDIPNIDTFAWQYVNGTLSKGLSGSRAIIYGNDILNIGGYHYNGAANYESFINVIDITTNSILADTGGSLAYAVVGAAAIIVNQRAYIFGGACGACVGGAANWQYIDLHPTLQPTAAPTYTFVTSSLILPDPIRSGGATIYNDTLTIVSGYGTNFNWFSDAYSLSLHCNSWKSTSYAMPLDTTYISIHGNSVRVDDLLYVINPIVGGGSAVSAHEMFIFSVITDEYVVSTRPTNRGEHVCVVYNKDANMIYAIGGLYPANNRLTYTQIYDITQDIWTQGGELNVARDKSGCAIDENNDNIIISGGVAQGNSVLNSVEKYNVNNDTWNVLDATLTTQRQYHTCQLFEGNIFMMGGNDGTSALSSVEIFDPNTDSFIDTIYMNAPRLLFKVSLWSNDCMFIIGGYSGSANYDSIEYYGDCAGFAITPCPTSDPTESPSMEPTQVPTTPPSKPPTQLVECYTDTNSTYRCETHCYASSAACIDVIDDTADVYDLYCNGTDSCAENVLFINNTKTVNIYCYGLRVCRLMHVKSIGQITNEINVYCSGKASCAYSTFIHENALSTVNTYCQSYAACLDLTIYAMPISELNLHCSSVYACWETHVYAPLFQFNSTLNLNLTSRSIKALLIYHPNIFASSHYNINIQCSEPQNIDCVIYSGVQGLILVHGAQLDEYCNYFMDNNCSQQYTDIRYIYANVDNYPALNLINNALNVDSSNIMIFIPEIRNESFALSAKFYNATIAVVSKKMEHCVFDFSLVQNIVTVMNQVDDMTIYGPTNSFTYIEWFGYAENSRYYLNNTNSIYFPCLGCWMTSSSAGNPEYHPYNPWQTLVNSQLYIGDSLDVTINCADNSGKDCKNLDLYSDLNLNQLFNYSLIVNELWDISCEGQQYGGATNCVDFVLHFDPNITCKYNETHPCAEYLLTQSPTNAPTISTSAPTESPSEAPTFDTDLEYILILKHDNVSNGLFNSSIRSTGLENEDNVTANTYSIIGRMNYNSSQFQAMDGKYQFKMIYYKWDGTQDVLVWRQSSWLTQQYIKGYEAISVPSQKHMTLPSCRGFHGLALSDWTSDTFLDGNGYKSIIAACGWNRAGVFKYYATGIAAFRYTHAYRQELYIYNLYHTFSDNETTSSSTTLSPTSMPTEAPYIVPDDEFVIPTNASFLCVDNVNYCSINCSNPNLDCVSKQLYVNDGPSHVEIFCDNSYDCSQTNMYLNHTNNVTIYCIGVNACRSGGVFYISNSKNVTIICRENLACYGGNKIMIDNVDNFRLECIGTQSCQWTSFVSKSSCDYNMNIDVICSGTNSCNSVAFSHVSYCMNDNQNNGYITHICGGSTSCYNALISVINAQELIVNCPVNHACTNAKIYVMLNNEDDSVFEFNVNATARPVIWFPNAFITDKFIFNCDIGCIAAIEREASELLFLYGEYFEKRCIYQATYDNSTCNDTYLDQSHAVKYNYIVADRWDINALNDNDTIRNLNESLSIMFVVPPKSIESLLYARNNGNALKTFTFIPSSYYKKLIILCPDIYGIGDIACQRSTFDLSQTESVSIIANYLYFTKVIGPSNELIVNDAAAHSQYNTFWLENTQRFSIPVYSHNVGDYAGVIWRSDVIIGNQTQLDIYCGSCQQTNIFMDINPNEHQLYLWKDINIHCKDSGECIDLVFVFKDDLECYFTEIDPCSQFFITSHPTTEPTHEPTNEPTIEPTNVPSYDPTVNPTFIPTSIPTFIPTNIPSTNPTYWPSNNPTNIPTNNPTSIPTEVTSFPTLSDQVNDGVTFALKVAANLPYVIDDVFGRFEIVIEITINGSLDINIDVDVCNNHCFKWFMIDYNTINTNAAADDNWIVIDPSITDEITIYSQQIDDSSFESTLIVSSIRTKYNGFGINEDKLSSHILKPNGNYGFKVQLNEDYAPSNIIPTETKPLLSNGECTLLNTTINSLQILDALMIDCNGWKLGNNTNVTLISSDLSYNLLINGVLLTPNFTTNLTQLTSIIPLKESDVEIVVLIEDPDGAKTAFVINDDKFPGIEDIINGTKLYQDIMYYINNRQHLSDDKIIILYSIIDGIHRWNDGDTIISFAQRMQIISDLFEIIMQRSNDTKNVINELAILVTLTSNENIINITRVLQKMTEFYFVQLVDIMESYIDSYSMQELFQTVTLTQALIVNLEIFAMKLIENNDMNDEYINTLTETLIELELYFAHIALTYAVPGESFRFSYISNNGKDFKHVHALKFQSGSNIYYDYGYEPLCGYNNQYMEISSKFIHDNSGIFDCTFSTSSRTQFIQASTAYRKASNVVNVNIYKTTEVIADNALFEYESDDCEPYLVSIDITNTSILNFNDTIYSLNDDSSFPFCGYWNNANSSFIERGCYVYSYNDTNVICACSHLTSFQLSFKDFVPEANLLTVYNFRQLNIQNLLKYPTIWIVIITLLILCVLMCAINPKAHKREKPSIIAYEDAIFKSFKNEMISHDIIGREIKYIDDMLPNKEHLGAGLMKLFGDTKEHRQSICYLQLKLFLIYLRNDHTLLSMFQRTAGTNFSTNQRISCFYMYLITVILSTAVFYGVEHKLTQDIAASFLISIVGKLPVRIVKTGFKKVKPEQIKRQIIVKEHDDFLKQRAKRLSFTTNRMTSKSDKAGEKDEDEDDEELQAAKLASLQHLDTMREILKKTHMNTKQYTVHDALKKVKASDSMHHRIELVDDIRLSLFNATYTLPTYYNIIFWIILILWSLAAAIISITYGISFDLLYETTPNAQNYDTTHNATNCWFNNEEFRIIDDLTHEYVLDENSKLREYFPGTYSDSGSFVLSVFISVLLSLFVWQPITIYMMTWIKLWAFSWHLRLVISVKNMWRICMRCCGRDKKYTKHFLLSSHSSFKEAGFYVNADNGSILARGDRPLDVIGFFANEPLFLETDHREIHELKLMKSTAPMHAHEIELMTHIERNQNNDNDNDYRKVLDDGDNNDNEEDDDDSDEEVP